MLLYDIERFINFADTKLINMKKLIVILCMLLNVVSVMAITKISDYICKDGKERTHRIDNWMRCKDLGLDYKYDWWEIPVDSGVKYLRQERFYGLIFDDIMEFCRGTEFEGLSVLHLEVEPYATKVKPLVDELASLRKIVFNDTLHKELTQLWFCVGDYNIKRGGFEIDLSMDKIQMLGKWANYPVENFFVGNDILKHFKSEPGKRFDGGKIVDSEVYEPSIFIPMDNKRLALSMLDPQYKEGTKKFSMIMQYKVNTSMDYPFFEAVDFHLVYLPTQQIVWSASTGDHSMEVTFE